MNVLVMTAMYPTPENPAFGSFVRTQVEALKEARVGVELFVLAGRSRKAMYPLAAARLRRRLTATPVDLIHAHYSYVGMVARTQWRVPVVVTYHGDDLLGTVANQKGEKTALSPFIVGGGRLLGAVADAAIVQSREMAAKLAFKKNVYIMPHEVDLDLFRPLDKAEARARLGLHPDKSYLLFAANPQVPVKRFSLAQAAVDVLEHHRPATELVVVYKETQDQLALYMNACDALVFPSFQEGSPNIVKQAMACNLPIVATDVGDVREVIGTTPGCYLLPPDAHAFAARLAKLLQVPKRTEGRETIRRFDRGIVTNKLVHIYQETLQRKRDGARRPGHEEVN